jgi:ankyrin repeat protein
MAMLTLLLLLAQTTALHEAVLHNATAAEVLIEVGADPNSRDDSGASPLDEAAWRGSAAKAALLLDGGAKIDAPDTRTGATPLNEAAFRGHIEVVELLLAHGAEASIKDHAGFSPIENAVRQHQPEMVRVLLGTGKNAELANRLLEMAVRRGYADSVEVLLDAGAAIDSRAAFDSRGARGSTVLYDAALAGNGPMVSLLVNHGADVNAVESASGTTPLYAAAAFGREESVAILLLGGATRAAGGQ